MQQNAVPSQTSKRQPRRVCSVEQLTFSGATWKEVDDESQPEHFLWREYHLVACADESDPVETFAPKHRENLFADVLRLAYDGAEAFRIKMECSRNAGEADAMKIWPGILANFGLLRRHLKTSGWPLEYEPDPARCSMNGLRTIEVSSTIAGKLRRERKDNVKGQGGDIVMAFDISAHAEKNRMEEEKLPGVSCLPVLRKLFLDLPGEKIRNIYPYSLHRFKAVVHPELHEGCLQVGRQFPGVEVRSVRTFNASRM